MLLALTSFFTWLKKKWFISFTLLEFAIAILRNTFDNFMLYFSIVPLRSTLFNDVKLEKLSLFWRIRSIMENRNTEQNWRPSGRPSYPAPPSFFPSQWYATVIYTLLPFRCANIPYCRNSEMALLPGAFVRSQRGIFPRAHWTWNSVILTMNAIPSSNNFQVQFPLNLDTLKWSV